MAGGESQTQDFQRERDNPRRLPIPQEDIDHTDNEPNYVLAKANHVQANAQELDVTATEHDLTTTEHDLTGLNLRNKTIGNNVYINYLCFVIIIGFRKMQMRRTRTRQ